MWRGIPVTEANLAYVAEDDPALALHEFRRRRAEAAHVPENVHTPVRKESRDEIPDDRAMANLCKVAAKAREMNAIEGSERFQLHQWADRDEDDGPRCGLSEEEYKGPIHRFDQTTIDDLKKSEVKRQGSKKSTCKIC